MTAKLPPSKPNVDPTQWFYVALHDVAPCFAPQVREIVETIGPLVGGRISAGVVPDWHGTHDEWFRTDYAVEVRRQFPELLLHGLTHTRAAGSRLGSRLTGNPGEFQDITSSQLAAERVCQAQLLFRKIFGVTAVGFLPPAWRLTRMEWPAWETTEIRFVVRRWRIEFEDGTAWPIHTWSWDYGEALGRAGVAGELFATATWPFRRPSIPCIALHPLDVNRGLLRRSANLIKWLTDKGRKPILPAEREWPNVVATSHFRNPGSLFSQHGYDRSPPAE